MSTSERWVEFENDSGLKIPAGAIMRVTGTKIINSGHVVLTVDQPNSYGDTGTCMINGNVPVAPTASGVLYNGACTRTGIVVGYYDSAQTPAFGQSWGPVASSWKFTQNSGGWQCLGPPTNPTLNYALFSPLPFTRFYGKNAGSQIALNGSGAINIYSGRMGSQADSGFTVGVVAAYGAIAANAFVECTLNLNGSVQGDWLAVQTSLCPA